MNVIVRESIMSSYHSEMSLRYIIRHPEEFSQDTIDKAKVELMKKRLMKGMLDEE